MQLNQRAMQLVDAMISSAEDLRVAVQQAPGGTRIVDCGVHTPGGLEAGRRLAEVCLAGLASVELTAPARWPWALPAVAVRTDQPLAACLASQYAGWRIAVGKFFAMGSGPMRALAAKEPLFATLGWKSAEPVAVGVLECGKLPPPEACQYVAQQCGVQPSNLSLLVAPTASQAGTVQVVARSVESALHKLLEVDFDLRHVESAFGVAPLPPVAGDDLAAMGRTNDAILYGGEVTLWLRADDAQLAAIGPKIPSQASAEHGRPFAEIFDRHGRDFYGLDPSLFGPAVVELVNLATGRTHRFGRLMPEVLKQSFRL